MATEAKQTIRLKIKQTVSALNENAVSSQSKSAQSLILALPQYREASRVGIYLSMPTGEAQTDLLVQDALHEGKAVFVPYIYSERKLGTEQAKYKLIDMLRLYSLEEYRRLARDAWGIPKLPSDEIDRRENAMGGEGVSVNSKTSRREDMSTEKFDGLDVIVMPGVAFDQEMNRTGHGAGFYDRFLTRYREHAQRKKPFLGMPHHFNPIMIRIADQILQSDSVLLSNCCRQARSL